MIESNNGNNNAKAKAVSVRNGCKSFTSKGSKTQVLNNFCMTVSTSTIYSLLGASGCGKTTVLSSIVGVQELDSGDVRVFGRKPGSPGSGIPGPAIGYMPQEIALYLLLSIKELLEYFGRLYGMTEVEICQRMEFLSQFLHLPPPSQNVGTLSGGQRRRLSLAVCLLHEPALLILDEPTVGVDPLLRVSIWQYLRELVSQKQTTVIITTHYVEEARNSDTVGLMRNGRLLTEKPPQVLLEEYNTVLLEDIVMTLCKQDHDQRHSVSVVDETSGANGLRSSSDNGNCNSSQSDESVVVNSIDESSSDAVLPHGDIKPRSMSSRIKAIVVRNFWTTIRSPGILAMIFFLPSFNSLLVYNLIGHLPNNLKFGVVNPETNYSISVCDSLMNNNASEDKICMQQLSCGYLNSIPPDLLDMIAMSSEEEALENVKNGNTWGYLKFQPNYTEHLIDRIVAGSFPANESLEGSELSVRMDMSQYFAGQLVRGSLYRSFDKFARGFMKDCDFSSPKGEVALNFRKPIYGSVNDSYKRSVGPCVLLLITFFIPCLTASQGVLYDRKQGTMERSIICGAKRSDFIISIYITEGITLLLQSIFSYSIALFVLDGPIIGSHFTFIALIYLTGATGLSWSFAISPLCNEELEGIVLLLGAFLLNFPTTGLIWPLEATGKILHKILYALPLNWAMYAARAVLFRGWSITHPKVLQCFAMLFAFMIIFTLISFKFWRVR